MTNGDFRRNTVSRFIKKIPKELLDTGAAKERIFEEKRVLSTPAFKKGPRVFGTGIPVTKGINKVKKKPDYDAGDRVMHFKHGEGTVLSVADGGRDYEVTVEFDTLGVRKMLVGFAKLKKL